MANRNLFQTAAIHLLENLLNQLWGFKPNLIAPLVESKGVFRSVTWFLPNLLKYERILDRWGPIRTHLLATEISTLNGCPYCANGHAYALQLHYLKKTEQLFPLRESDIITLQTQSESEIVESFESALEQAELSICLLDLRRMVDLRQDPTLAMGEKDRDILHLIRLFAVLNACAIEHNVKIDQAHDPINKNRAWRDRYAILRRAESRMPSTPTEPERTILNPSDLYM